jgi:hypothetical protein
MSERHVAHADAFAAAGGYWHRGDAEIARIPAQNDGGFAYRSIQRGETVDMVKGVKVIRFEPRERYPLAKHGRAAIKALLRLAATPTDSDVVDFARRFGPLFNFSEWLAGVRYIIGEVRDGQEWLRPEFPDSRSGKDYPYLRPPSDGTAAGLGHAGSDAYLFMKWCADNDHHEAAAYMQAALRDWPRSWGDLSSGLLREPVALYIWAARQLAAFQQDDRTPAARTFLAARLDETRLVPAPEAGRLVMSTTSLLAYVTIRVHLDRYGYAPEVRFCRECGAEFSPSDPRQRYCKREHQWRGTKRAIRARERLEAKDAGSS